MCVVELWVWRHHRAEWRQAVPAHCRSTVLHWSNGFTVFGGFRRTTFRVQTRAAPIQDCLLMRTTTPMSTQTGLPAAASLLFRV